jgi:His-Xaa-Ser system radical SAM maturase HxsC
MMRSGACSAIGRGVSMVTLGDKIHHNLGPSDHNIVVKVKADDGLPASGRHAILIQSKPDRISTRASFYLTCNAEIFESLFQTDTPIVLLPNTLSHVEPGDILRMSVPDSQIRVLFKRSHRQNSFLLTERCNNWCVMCSQPPRNVDDAYIVTDVLEAISLIDPQTPEIGFTGGEPTLVGESFFKLIKAANNYLPRTALHILSNGRTFAKETFARKVAEIAHSDLMIGIPLYADNSADHNYVVQASAFNETISGIFNLKRFGVKVEIRVVLHSATYHRLPALARYITRNLLFVDQVVLMGLEAMGFGKSNFQSLWIAPELLVPKVDESIAILNRAGIKTMVYNLPLCILGTASRAHAVRSISDWKNEYLEECDSCLRKLDCCGFFSSTKQHYKDIIRPMH